MANAKVGTKANQSNTHSNIKKKLLTYPCLNIGQLIFLLCCIKKISRLGPNFLFLHPPLTAGPLAQLVRAADS